MVFGFLIACISLCISYSSPYYPSSTLLYPSFFHVFPLYLKHSNKNKMFIKQTLCLLFYIIEEGEARWR